MSKQSGSTPLFEYSNVRGGPRRYAKLLLRRVQEGDPSALSSFEQFHPRFDQARGSLRLADAQLVVARMSGYRSWPQMKHHQEALAQARDEIDRGAPAPDGERPTAHLRCGRDIEPVLRRAGYVGRFVEVADPLCHGPVPRGSSDALLEARARFIAHAYELDLEATRQRIDREWAELERLPSRTVLWFEHDPYDQLILAAVLAQAPQGRDLELICVDDYPGRPGFKGLGELHEESLRALWSERRPVGADDRELGAAVWSALREPDPRALHRLSQGTASIRPMTAALRRHLQELPWVADGLSLTQRLTLEVIRTGANTVGSVLRGLQTADPLPFFSDTMLGWEVRQLAAGGAVSLTPRSAESSGWSIVLTDLGHDLLEGRADWRDEATATRWVGGIACGTDQPDWRWDPGRGAPTLRAPSR